MSQSRLWSMFGGVLVVILLVTISICGADEDKDSVEKDSVEDVEDDFESDILTPLGPLKSSRVLRTTYYLSRIETDWFSARQHCIDHRLRLLSIEDLEEDSEITQFLIDERVQRSWTSGNDLDQNGHFIWGSTRKSMVYTNWHRFGVPKDPRRSCVFTGTDRFWGDGTYGWDEEHCSNRLKFICEETF